MRGSPVRHRTVTHSREKLHSSELDLKVNSKFIYVHIRSYPSNPQLSDPVRER